MRFRRVASSVWSQDVGPSRVAGSGRPRSGPPVTASSRGKERADRVRAYLEAFFAGDLDTARPMVTPDFSCRLTDLRGRPVTLVGFDAVSDFVRERSEALGMTVMYELSDFLPGEDQVCVVFEERPPLTPGADTRQLALWTFRGELIASVRIYGVPQAASPQAGDPVDGADRTTVMTFIDAWVQDDRERMARLVDPGVTCRWIGFGPERLSATGLEAVLRIGRGLELARRGPVNRVTIMDQMDGQEHVAVLLEATPHGGDERTVSLGLYRVTDGRITTIAIYADRRS